MPFSKKKQIAARQNIKKAQARWESVSRRQHSLAKPKGRAGRRPGAGGGLFYRVEVRPKSEFVSFRTHDVGEEGNLERIAGKRRSGSWDTATWLVEKKAAHLNEKGQLVIDDPKARTALKQIRGPIVHKKGDIFRAFPAKSVAESANPTEARVRSWHRKIKRAQPARKST